MDREENGAHWRKAKVDSLICALSLSPPPCANAFEITIGITLQDQEEENAIWGWKGTRCS